MYKLIFFVPVSEAERVKEAVFETGAGCLGNYSRCSFETEGVGQFLPGESANPALGQRGKVERVRELKVEVLCSEVTVAGAIRALLAAHPYEEPAYEIIKLENPRLFPR